MRMILKRNCRNVIRRLNRYTTMVDEEGKRNTIVIAMSGGVDSSVAAHLVNEQISGKTDQNLIGLYMKNWNDTENGAYCEVSERDVRDVQQVCDMLNIPLHHVSFAAEYWTQVFEPFLDDMSSSPGSMKTPNPDINCNSQIKFGTMREYAQTKLHASLIVTGHYARLWHRHSIPHTFIQTENDELEHSIQTKIDEDSSLNHWIRDWDSNRDTPFLVAAKDLTKDQSYFLSGVSSFHNVWFPLGNYYKNNTHTSSSSSSSSIRQLAQEYKLPNAQKKDSMGICFIGNSRNKNQFSQFLSQYITIPSESVQFIDIDTGTIISTAQQEREKSKNHWYPPYYTIGQGAKLSGASTKWFVTTTTSMKENHKDENVIWVCNDTHHPSLYSNELYINIQDFNWIGGTLPPPPLISKTKEGTLQAFCRMRHLQPLIPCTIKWYVHHDNNKYRTCMYV